MSMENGRKMKKQFIFPEYDRIVHRLEGGVAKTKSIIILYNHCEIKKPLCFSGRHRMY
jgi:hypothetical protein